MIIIIIIIILEESLINMNIIVFIIGFIIGIMLTLVAYHKHPVRIIRETHH